MNDVQHQRKGRELRIAVAMRGGVSLAVWMGGACREITRLRSANDNDVYGRLLRRFGYGDVKIDVLAGTSAGGLNGAILATHLVYGMPFDHRVRNLWLRLGHLELLTRSPSEGAPPSLLCGDEQFFVPLVRALRELLPEEVADTDDAYVRLILTATRLTPRGDHMRPQRGPLLAVGQSHAHFRFRHRPKLTIAAGPGTALSDFTPRGSPGDVPVATLRCLAYAARTTSSFPGAFEPALPFVGPGAAPVPAIDPDGDPTPPDPELIGLPVDFRGVSSETGAPDPDRSGQVELIDGGVLDNIPISWAVRSIAAVPAQRAVDRWLMYLQPVPPLDARNEPSTTVEQRRVTRLVRLLRTTSATKANTESLLDDAEEMRKSIADAQRRSAIAGHSLPATTANGLMNVATASFPSYRRLVGRAEAERFIHLLEDPIGVIGGDPLPIPAAPTPLTRLDAVNESQAFIAAFRRLDVVDELAAGSQFDAGFRTPFACARAAALLLDIVRAIEADGGEAVDTAEVRGRIYDLRFASEVLIAARDRLMLRLIEGSTDARPLASVRLATERLAQIVEDVPMPDVDGDWASWAEQLAEQVTLALGPGAAPLVLAPDTGTWPTELFAPLWAQAAATVARLAAGYTIPARFAVFKHATNPAAALAILRDCEIVVGPLRPEPLSATSQIDFTAVSAANVSPIERVIFRADLNPAARVSAKLSGDQIHNFGAFLSARWRAADWTWGRLDTAQSLVESIVRSGQWPEDFGVGDIHAFFVDQPPPGEASATGETWAALLDRRWSERQASLDTEVNSANFRERFIDVATERLQWEILADELPVLESLAAQTDPDGPPEAEIPDPSDPPPPTADQLRVLADIGSENVVELVHQRPLRRAVLRLGLVGWRAVMPSGDGVDAKSARWAAGLTIKPLAWVPILLALVSPVSAVIASLLAAVGVAVATNRIVTFPAQIFTFAGIIGSVWLLALEYRARHRRDPDALSGWAIPIAWLVTAVLAVGPIVLLVAWPENHPGSLDQWLRVVLATFTLTLTLGVLRWIVSKAYLCVLVVATGAITFGVACLTVFVDASWDPLRSWRALLLVFVPLAVITFALTWFYPKVTRPDSEAEPQPAPTAST